MHPSRLFEAAFHSASIGMALVGLDGRWLRVNPALCRIVGYSEPELLARSFQDITHPEDLDADLALLRRLIEGEINHYELEKRYFHREGHVVWIQLSVALARDESGAPEVMVAQIQEVTSRKNAERALQESLRASEKLLSELNAAQSELRKLKEGLLTMCSWTKRIQHDGRWMSVDEFLSQHLQIHVTHGISEEAYARVMEELDQTITAASANP